MLEGNKTQLFHQIRLPNFTTQAPLAESFLPEADWQKDDQMPVAPDDLFAQSWNRNFGPNPFDDNSEELSQNIEDTKIRLD